MLERYMKAGYRSRFLGSFSAKIHLKELKMKRFVLSLIVVFSLFGAVGCMNQNDISKTDVGKPTPVTTKIVADEKPKETINFANIVGSQSKTNTKTDDNKKAKDISSFIPTGWHTLEKNDGKLATTEGDLNKDGIIDKAVVIESDTQPKEPENFGPPRSLLIAFKNKNNTYSLSIKADNAIMLRDQGGVFGDPLQDIKIERGSILLEFYGGSSSRWYMYYRFRYQNNGWYLIGATEGEYLDTVTTMDNADEEDYNLLTGDYVIKKFGEDGKITTTKGNRGKRQLMNLENFVPGSDEF